MKNTAILIRALLVTALMPTVALAGDPELERGKELFNAKAVPACAVCHSLRDAGATGAIGPDLNELQPDAERVLKAIRGGLGVMPAYDRSALSDADAQAIAHYVAKASRQ